MGLGDNSTLPLSVFRVAVIHFDHASFTLIFYSFYASHYAVSFGWKIHCRYSLLSTSSSHFVECVKPFVK